MLCAIFFSKILHSYLLTSLTVLKCTGMRARVEKMSVLGWNNSLGCLRGSGPALHFSYLGKNTRPPIRPPATLDKADRTFAEIRGAIPNHPQKERHCQAWISPETWSLIDTRTAARRQGDQRSSWDLAHAINIALQGDRHRWAGEVGSEVESLLASNPPLTREAWIRMRGWYKDAVDHPHPQPEWP